MKFSRIESPSSSSTTTSSSRDSPAIKTLAFFDLETTGLPDLEFFKTKITELSIVTCSVAEFIDPKVTIPRVQHKLTLCFNPFKMVTLKASEITGLTNELLECENKFDANAMNLLSCFFFKLQQPICLIAHNGNNFDFPLLKKQCDVLNGAFPFTIKCCDSLPVFRKLDELAERKVEMLKEPYSLQEWNDAIGDGLILSSKVEEILENDDKKEESDDDEAVDKVLQELINNELKEVDRIEQPEQLNKKPDLNGANSWQVVNETTPNKPITAENLHIRAPQHAASPSTPETRKRSTTSKRELFPEPPTTSAAKKVKKSFALPQIYNRFFGSFPDNSHDAESDVLALLKCAANCREDFMRIITETCIDFNDVKKF